MRPLPLPNYSLLPIVSGRWRPTIRGWHRNCARRNTPRPRQLLFIASSCSGARFRPRPTMRTGSYSTGNSCPLRGHTGRSRRYRQRRRFASARSSRPLGPLRRLPPCTTPAHSLRCQVSRRLHLCLDPDAPLPPIRPPPLCLYQPPPRLSSLTCSEGFRLPSPMLERWYAPRQHSRERLRKSGNAPATRLSSTSWAFGGPTPCGTLASAQQVR